MEITQEENAVIDRIVKTAYEKWRGKLSILANAIGFAPVKKTDFDPLVGPDDESPQYRRLKIQVGEMLKWIFVNKDEKRDELKENGLRVVEAESRHTGYGDMMKLVMAFDGTDIPPQTFRCTCLWGDPVADLPGRPKRHPCRNSQQTMEYAVHDLKRVDMYINLAVRYSNVRSSIRRVDIAESHERVNKSLHQLELLEKL